MHDLDRDAEKTIWDHLAQDFPSEKAWNVSPDILSGLCRICLSEADLSGCQELLARAKALSTQAREACERNRQLRQESQQIFSRLEGTLRKMSY